MVFKVTPMTPLLELRGSEYPITSALMSGGYVLLSSVNGGKA